MIDLFPKCILIISSLILSKLKRCTFQPVKENEGDLKKSSTREKGGGGEKDKKHEVRGVNA